MNRKLVFSVMTILIMLITSRFFVRIIDATVQIDDDIGYLIILLILLNTAIGLQASGCTEGQNRK